MRVESKGGRRMNGVPAKSKRKKPRWSRDDTELTLLALPTTVWFALFAFLPMFGIILAFKDFRIYGRNFIENVFKSAWAGDNGLKNFESLLKFKKIDVIVRNTIGYNLLFIVLTLVVAVALALIIGQLYSKRKSKVYQTILFMPYFLSWVVVSAAIWGFLSYDNGLINSIIEATGGQRVQWYMRPEYWPYFLTFMYLWKMVGYSMVVYLAVITGLDSSYYEAALIDGASKWQQARYITLPLMKSIIIIMFIMNIGRIMFSDFGLFYQVPRGSNSLFDVTYTIDVYVYSIMAKGTAGMAAATALVQSVVGCVMVLGANFIIKKVDPESAMI